MRRLSGRSGSVRFSLTVDPRFDYGRRDASWETREGHGGRATSGGESITLYTELPFAIAAAATASFSVAAGEVKWLRLEYRRNPVLWHRPAPAALEADLDATCEYWRRWSSKCRRGMYHDAVRRSALVLKLLGYGPTRAIIAAPTTSLPEHLGGVRN